MKQTSRKLSALFICLIGILLLYPKLITLIPRFDKPLPILLLVISFLLIVLAIIFKSQRGLIFPGILLLLLGLFFLFRKEPFFPSYLNGIIILPLIMAVSFLSLLPFEPKKRKVIIPSLVFFVIAGSIYFSQGILSKIFEQISIEPLKVVAILLILWGMIRFFRK